MKISALAGNNGYRYGFNGAEVETSFTGSATHYDLGTRMYDARLGRMFSVDPRTSEYSWQSPYVYHRNSPISIVDYFGAGGDGEGVERGAVTVEKGNTLWSIAKNSLEEGSTDVQVQNEVNRLMKINEFNDEQAANLAIGQVVYTESNEAYQLRKDKSGFLDWDEPKPTTSKNPIGRIQEEVGTYGQLLATSLKGKTEMSYLEGELKESLQNDVRLKEERDRIVNGVLQNLDKINQEDYYHQVDRDWRAFTFGAEDRVTASIDSPLALFTMRHADIKTWVIVNTVERKIHITYKFSDTFNLDKNGSSTGRDKVTEKLGPIYHETLDGNFNYQLRAIWTETIEY